MMRLVDKNFLFSWFFTLVVCASLNSCGGARSLTEGSPASSAYSDANDISAENHEATSFSGLGSSELTSPTVSTGLEDDALSGGFDTSSAAPGSSDFSAQPASLFIKRLDVAIDDDEVEASFRSSIVMQREEFIQISCSAPMGMELLRILLTQDSIKLLNFHDKWFSLSDYKSFFASSRSLPTFAEFQSFVLDLVEYSEENPDKPYKLGLAQSQVTDATTITTTSPILILLGILFPDHSDSLRVVLEIKKIEVNLEVKENFRIPAKYQEVYSLSDI